MNTPSSSTSIPMASARSNAGAGAAGPGLGWVDPPKGFKLRQVHYLMRHGERTPVRVRMTQFFPERWNLCHAGRQFDAAVLDLTPASDGSGVPFKVGQGNKQLDVFSNKMRVQRAVEGEDASGNPKAGQDGECLLGDLTDLGRLSTLRFGKELRSLYVDRLGFLPPRLSSHESDQFHFRSTNITRTIESLQQAIRGIHPQIGQGFVPTIHTRNIDSENLLPNTYSCSRLRALDRVFADAAARLMNPELEKLDSKFMPYTDGVPPRVDGHPRLNGILDTVKAAQAHGLAVPPPMTEPETMQLLEKAVVAEWFSGYQAEDGEKRLEFRRLAMGRLLQDLNSRLQSKASKGGSDPLKFALYATHDTTLAGLLSTLDCFDRRWPVYTATVGVELFQDTKSPPSILQRAKSTLTSWTGGEVASSPNHYVRVRYGDRTMNLPACAPKGKHLDGHPEFCTLDAFRQIANELRHPEGWSWSKQCKTGQASKSSK